MTISDLVAITELRSDTVNDIVKERLEKDYGHPRLKELTRVSMMRFMSDAGGSFTRWSLTWTAGGWFG
jgi:hypothetical protein